MTPDERQLLTGLFDRVRQATGNPRDAEAEAFIADQVRAQPAAPYLLAQTVLVQEQALRAANEHIQKLEAELQQAQQHMSQQPPAQEGGSFLGGLGKSLFGGGSSAPVPPQPAPRGPWGNMGQSAPPPPGWGAPPPSQAWGAPPPPQGYGAPPSGGGSSFLHGALGTAAGVAGGVLLANSIRGLFGNNNAFGIGSGFGGGMPAGGFGLGGFGAGGLGAGGLGSGGMGAGGGETVINNYYDQPSDNDQSDVTDANFNNSNDDNTPDDASWGQDDSGDVGGNDDDGTYDT